MLEQTQTLMTLAEVSATFAGFTALITLFARQRVEGGSAHDLMRLRLVIGASVIVVMAALIPVAVSGLGIDTVVVWQISALLFQILTYFVVASFLSAYMPVRGSFPPDRLALSVVIIIEIAIQLSLFTILLGANSTQHFGLYLLALIGTLSQASFVFLRLVESSFSNFVERPGAIV